MTKQPLLNTSVNNVSMDEAVSKIECLVEKKQKAYIVAVNTDVIMKIENDIYLKKIVDKADLVLIDGQPLVWISKWYGHPVKQKVSGSDLVPEICKTAKDKGYSIFILGGKDEVAKAAKINLEQTYSGLNVVDTYSPPLGFEKNDEENKKIIKKINQAHPDILIVCFGCPKQEKWIYENYEKYDSIVSVCAGATVDFLAGNVKRAPKWMSNHGLEWLFRFISDPKRLFKRYFIDDVKIISLLNKYR
jgi:N-acetylglucosaminyldiphosphoundecaprenol N-acetyl-beta-D-mannosaminyltransferase